MKRSKILDRWSRLTRPKKLLLVEALLALGASSAAIRLLPFRRAVKLGSRPLAPVKPAVLIEQARWAVDTAARHIPWRTVCFHKGIALQWMLRRRGVNAMLHYGVARDQAGDLEAHVWVATEGQVIIGGEEAPRFRRVATFP